MKYIAKHLKTILKHKWVVFKECAACGIIWRGIVHDMSKFSPSEFLPSARHFQGNRSPIEAEKEEQGYSLAWYHHKGYNKHHWEYWTDFDGEGNVIPGRIPLVYVIEMVCDWIGAGKVYGGGNWTQEEPLKYYEKVRRGRYFHPDTENIIRGLLVCIKDDGLSEFHRVCRNVMKGKRKGENQ